jgi:hypothetical protein
VMNGEENRLMEGMPNLPLGKCLIKNQMVF